VGLALTRAFRADEWWEYKLAPILAAMYATALTLDVAVTSIWPALLVALAALVPGAAYVSLINDATDREDDLAAAKPNRLANHSRISIGLLIAGTVAAGLVFSILWRRDPLLLPLYLAAWLAFSLYSLPPFRWKARGILGVIADASGAHLFPTLVAVVVTFRWADRPVSVAWMVAVGAWAFMNGLRGILWHQLSDAEHDRRAMVRTFARRHDARAIGRAGAFVILPIELAALAGMLWQMWSVIPAIFLALHLRLMVVRLRTWQMHAVIVAPKPRFLIVLHEYYDGFLPLAVLCAAAWRHPADSIVLAIHLLLFPTRMRQAVNDAVTLRSYLWK
jgi:UbiA prenyltransferase family